MDSGSTERVAETLQPGRLNRALIRLFMKRASVVGFEPVAEGFRLITVESPEFQGIRWIPGQKIQVALGSAFVSRTFTPIEWDAKAGRTRILAYAHGASPGSEWIRSMKAGDECDIFGPRASLDVSGVAGPVVVFGDETSIGLGYSILRQNPNRAVHCLLEVGSVETSRSVLSRLDLSATELFERRWDTTHLQEIEQRLPAFAAAGATFVLTGKASSIQQVRRALKALDIPASRLASKAYWAPGKTGLD